MKFKINVNKIMYVADPLENIAYFVSLKEDIFNDDIDEELFVSEIHLRHNCKQYKGYRVRGKYKVAVSDKCRLALTFRTLKGAQSLADKVDGMVVMVIYK